jgi:membrane protease YdiL (CAAX protease family)
MFASARKARRLPNVVVAVVVLLVATAIGFILATIAERLIYGEPEDVNLFRENYYWYVVPFTLIVGALWIWVRVYEKRPFHSLGFTPNAALRKYLVGFMVGFAMQALTVGLMALSGGVVVEQAGDIATGMTAIGGSLLVLTAFVVQGASEEIVCRGWYLPVLGARYRPVIAVVVSTVLFAALHLSSQPVAIVNLLLFGLFLALYSLREGSIWGVCGWHTAWNWSMANVFGLEFSGQAPFGGTIVNLQATGSPFSSGGEYGPEGSLAATLIFSAAVIGVVCRPGFQKGDV